MIYRVWAPFASEMSVEVGQQTIGMTRSGEWWEAYGPEGDYWFVFDGKKRADPRSRWQPHGVHGPSRHPPRYEWSDDQWLAPPLESWILYELHVGAFTTEGTFDGVITKLPYLKDLGINALSLMPVAAFPGSRGWGYDGVYPYAVQECYGGPAGLMRLVDAAHRAGIAVVMDVVYNHLGPEGNYLADFGPYFTDRYKTPWGPAINYDGAYSDEVRRYFIDNALMWQRDYHIDGLRLDAVHAIYDFSAHHILKELKESVDIPLIAESDLNDSRILTEYGIDAQWNDDFHHAVKATLTGDRHAYFVDYHGHDALEKAFCDGYVIDGVYSQFRKRRHGNSTRDLPGNRFVAFTQNHDQIANASNGQRLTKHQEVAAQLLFFAPNIPMIFMGQEFGAKTPWLYFTDFEDKQLQHAVSVGYQKEHAANPIDPGNLNTFTDSKLNWDDQDPALLKLYKELIALRKAWLPNKEKCRVTRSGDDVTITYPERHLHANLQAGSYSCNLATKV